MGLLYLATLLPAPLSLSLQLEQTGRKNCIENVFLSRVCMCVCVCLSRLMSFDATSTSCCSSNFNVAFMKMN